MSDDRTNLFDIHAAVQALEIAMEALRKAMEGHGQEQREQFAFHVDQARERLERISKRISEAA